MEHAGVAVPLTPEEAERLAARLRGERRTRLGGIHIDHALRVARAAGPDDPRVTIIALLHDVIEKSDITPGTLRDLIGDPWIADAVEVFTKRDDESERAYLSRCAADPVICRLKRLDLADKLDSDDVSVTPEVARRLRRQARDRLRALQDLEASHHP